MNISSQVIACRIWKTNLCEHSAQKTFIKSTRIRWLRPSMYQTSSVRNNLRNTSILERAAAASSSNNQAAANQGQQPALKLTSAPRQHLRCTVMLLQMHRDYRRRKYQADLQNGPEEWQWLWLNSPTELSRFFGTLDSEFKTRSPCPLCMRVNTFLFCRCLHQQISDKWTGASAFLSGAVTSGFSDITASVSCFTVMIKQQSNFHHNVSADPARKRSQLRGDFRLSVFVNFIFCLVQVSMNS